MLNAQIKNVKFGLLLVLLTLVFGIGLGITFGIGEDAVQDYIAQGISAHPAVHDQKSAAKIWRYAQRSHFHATGIAAFSLGLVILVMFSSLKSKFKKIASTAIGLSGFYPLSWFTMFLLSPALGRSAAHHHIVTEAFTYIGVGGLLVGIAILSGNLFIGWFAEEI